MSKKIVVIGGGITGLSAAHRIIEIQKEKTNQHQGLEIAGNAYSGVGIPDCVHSGEQTAEVILKDLF